MALPDYKAMYFELAARVADAIELLVQAQQTAEERYINSKTVRLKPRPGTEKPHESK